MQYFVTTESNNLELSFVATDVDSHDIRLLSFRTEIDYESSVRHCFTRGVIRNLFNTSKFKSRTVPQELLAGHDYNLLNDCTFIGIFFFLFKISIFTNHSSPECKTLA